MRRYTFKQGYALAQLINRRRTEDAKGVAYVNRLAYHGEDKQFKKFLEAEYDDG